MAARKNTPWSFEEVQTFLGLVAGERIQRELDGATRNEKTFCDLSELMHEHGYERTSRQCREKLKKLKSDYRAIRDHSGRSGSNRKSWKWFSTMDAIYGHRAGSRGRDGDPDPATALMETLVEDNLKPESPRKSSSHGGNSASETSAPSPAPAPTRRDEPPPELRKPLITAPLDHRPHTSNSHYTGNASYTRRSILGKRRHQQTIHTEFLAYLRESDAAHQALLEAQHRQWMESREADRAAEVVQAAERLRVEETFNNQFISVFGQFVQVLRGDRAPADPPAGLRCSSLSNKSTSIS